MSYSFNLNASQAIDMALKMMNVTSLPDASNSSDYVYTLNILNMMLKDWATDGIHLWKRKQGALFISYNQNSYEVGSVSGADNCSLNTGYISTTLSVAGASGASTLTLSSVTGMTVGDNIGIELNNLSRQWTTITAINSSVVTLNTTLSSAASLGNTVITYTSKINRPLEILRASLLDLSTNTEIPMEKLTYDQYFNTPIKQVNFRPVNYYYDRVLNNTLPYTGTLYVYGNPESSKYIMKFSYLDTLTDIVNPTDILDIPQEWLLTLTTNLAVLLSNLGYGKLIEAQATQQLAASLKEKLKAFDSDDEPLSIVINSTSRNIS